LLKSADAPVPQVIVETPLGPVHRSRDVALKSGVSTLGRSAGTVVVLRMLYE
jgi:hypothetical protein